jgi:hypothetical protein
VDLNLKTFAREEPESPGISWKCGSSYGVAAWQVQSPEFNLQYHKKKKKKESQQNLQLLAKLWA